MDCRFDLPSFKAVTAAHFRACSAVRDFFELEVRPLAWAGINRSDPLQETCALYLDRVASWLRTVGKLNELTDFQAVDAAARSLFEIVVDLTLLKHDPDSPVEKMIDWELLAKVKRTKKRVEAQTAAGDQHSLAMAALGAHYVQQKQGDVDAALQKWGWNKTPPRWTGRDLLQDADRCDRLAGSAHATHYKLRFADLCWNVHGSAHVAIRNLDERAVLVGLAASFRDVVLLSRAVAELVLDLLGKFDASMAARFEQLDKDCDAAMAEPMKDLEAAETAPGAV